METKDYNVMIDGRSFFDQPVDSMAKTYENSEKVLQAKEMTIQPVVC